MRARVLRWLIRIEPGPNLAGVGVDVFAIRCGAVLRRPSCGVSERYEGNVKRT